MPKSTVIPAWTSSNGTKIYFDNDLSYPESFSLEEADDWRTRMFGSASCHVPPEIWARLRKEAAEDVLKTRTPKKVAS